MHSIHATSLVALGVHFASALIISNEVRHFLLGEIALSLRAKGSRLAQRRHARESAKVHRDRGCHRHVERLGETIKWDIECAIAQREQLVAYAEPLVAKDQRCRLREVDRLQCNGFAKGVRQRARVADCISERSASDASSSPCAGFRLLRFPLTECHDSVQGHLALEAARRNSYTWHAQPAFICVSVRVHVKPLLAAARHASRPAAVWL